LCGDVVGAAALVPWVLFGETVVLFVVVLEVKPQLWPGIDEELQSSLLLPPSEVCEEGYLDVVRGAAVGVACAVIDELIPSALCEVDFELCCADECKVLL